MSSTAAASRLVAPFYRPQPWWKRRARRMIRTVMTALLRLRGRGLDLQSGRCLLVIAPHQDDETLACAGLIMRTLASGGSVRVLYITDGSASHPGHPDLMPTELAARREAEALSAMALLGVGAESLTFLGAADGTLGYLSDEAAEPLASRIASAVSSLPPVTTIALPLRQDGSSEHDGAFDLVMRGLARAELRPSILEYPVWSWWNPLRLARPLVSSRRIYRLGFGPDAARKHRALACYRSQMEPTPPWTEPLLSDEFVASFSSSTEYFFET